MSESEIFLRILIALGLGFLVGIERDRNLESGNANVTEKGNLGGIRTYTTISLLGGLSGLIFQGDLVVITYLIFVFIALLVNISYVLHFIKTKSLGITTEVAIFLTFLLGFLSTAQVINLKFTLAFGVILAFVLAQKTGIHAWVSKVKRREVLDIIKYFVIVLAVYPFLPNKEYTLSDFPVVLNSLATLGADVEKFKLLEIVNPSFLWFIVVFISGINLLGYFLSKVFNEQRVTFLTSFFAGFISSTGLINAHSLKSREVVTKKDQLRLAAGGIIAHASSFFPILFVSLLLNVGFFNEIFFPLFIMFIVALVFGLALLLKSKNNTDHQTHELRGSVFSLTPALKLAVLISFVKIMSQLGLLLIGNAGFYLSVLLASLVGMDAVTVTVSELANNGVAMEVAVLTMVGAIATNGLMKILYSHFSGAKIFSRTIAVGLILSFLAGFFVVVGIF